MDRSLDELIKENPKKFSLNKGRYQPKPNKNSGNATGVKRGGIRNNKKNYNNSLPGVAKNGGGRVTKQGGRQNGANPVFKGNSNKQNVKPPTKKGGVIVVDARNKLLAKNRLKITDARDRLAAMAKKTDLRQKLASKKPELSRKPAVLHTRPNQGIKKLIREVGRSHNLTRTTIGRTVENELARLNVGPVASHYIPPRYDLLPPPNFYPYHQQAPSYDLKHNMSTAAMDCEPPLSATKRILSAEKRLGPRTEVKSKPETGHRIYVSNLHPKVTQEDIVELFGDVGSLVRASLQRPGVAEVVYVRRDDALRAVDVYHNRQLDGLPMHCSMGAIFEPRREAAPAAMKPRAPLSSGKAHIAPDIGTIHKALFNKATSRNSQIFTVTLPKKDT
ncbi:polymerase delta-interacting protein 3 [Daphnia magna]|uniref:Uncharacterized protein n=2 Tax=Daphnia magna TaxID=35525 RepID=A0ABR0ALY9_9CRUS|nr:polymerase delta-interacting protein 3 [Daphnia magna]KAK4026124.1 hypothetical protein OUZ56_015144 [Daphnia magna]KZS20427.1 polymerase Delta-interacting protein [Daphnia magna]